MDRRSRQSGDGSDHVWNREVPHCLSYKVQVAADRGAYVSPSYQRIAPVHIAFNRVGYARQAKKQESATVEIMVGVEVPRDEWGIGCRAGAR